MDLAGMIEALSDPSAYPSSPPVEAVEIRQTHISVVFLAGPHAYKIKKPLALGFLDYSTPERLAHIIVEHLLAHGSAQSTQDDHEQLYPVRA